MEEQLPVGGCRNMNGSILAKVILIYMKLRMCGLHVMLHLPVPPGARSEGPSSLLAALIRGPSPRGQGNRVLQGNAVHTPAERGTLLFF